MSKKTAIGSQPKSQKHGWKHFIKRFRRHEDGVTAIEFGLIAMPFIGLLVALLETALVFMTTLDLENAVKDASRQIRTGQAQNAGFSQNQFRQLLCDNISLIPNCMTNPDLVLDVRNFPNFNINLNDYYDENGNFKQDQLSFSMGSGLRVVTVRASYKMKLLTQFPGIGLANIGNTHRMINAMAIFRNEPF